jgi:transcriptional regulator with XRE-family HTH domain
MNITVDELAKRAGVSKSLISQIENNRTVPSLPVLFNIVHGLEDDLKSFFEDMQDHFSNNHVVVVKNGNGTRFEKEPVKGFTYKRILTRSITSQAADIVLLELKKGAGRKLFIQTDAFECKYILKGKVEYEVEREKFILEAGDTLFFDGRARHRLRNIGTADATILVVYLF